MTTDPRDVIALPEHCPDWGFTPTELLPSDKQAARRERIAAFKERIAQKRAARAEKRSNPVPLPPVYDEIWAEGVHWLDEEG